MRWIKAAIVTSFVIAISCIAVFWYRGTLFSSHDMAQSSPVSSRDDTVKPVTVVSLEEASPTPLPAEVVAPASLPVKTVLLEVPFTSQAPFAEWGQTLFQNACEEASLVMAEHFLSGKSLSKEEAKKEIVAFSKFEEKQIGHSIDTSAKDTESLFREYYGKDILSEVRYDISIKDMTSALSLGSVIIVPTNGRELKNPNFTAPGPEHHMLVVIGYDTQMKEFIVNDPGTRKGAGYRYPEDVLYGAIHDYPTGDHILVKNGRKAIIIVQKEQ